MGGAHRPSHRGGVPPLACVPRRDRECQGVAAEDAWNVPINGMAINFANLNGVRTKSIGNTGRAELKTSFGRGKLDEGMERGGIS